MRLSQSLPFIGFAATKAIFVVQVVVGFLAAAAFIAKSQIEDFRGEDNRRTW